MFTMSLASWKMNVNLARIQSVIIKQTFEELSLIRSGSIYGSGRIVIHPYECWIAIQNSEYIY